MKPVRIGSLQWLVGSYCAVIGTLMLVAPHQFAPAAYAALKPHMPLWGSKVPIFVPFFPSQLPTTGNSPALPKGP